MKITKIVSVLLVALAAASTAQAAEISTTASLGTTGFSLHLTTPLAAKLNARVGVNYGRFTYDGNTDDVQYDFKLKLATVDALLDYHPFDGAFRISGGLVYNGNNSEAIAKPNGNGTYELNGRIYPAAAVGDLSGKMEFRKTAPYLGIGFGNAVKAAGWNFGMDLGVTFQGAPETSLSNRGCNAPAAVCTQIASDVAAENASFKEEVKDFDVYPVIRVGVSYRF